MSYDLSNKFVVAISSRALFDLVREDRIFQRGGPDVFIAYQKKHRDVPPAPGPAMPLVASLLELNEFIPDRPVEVVLLSKNSPSAAIRMRNALDAHGVRIERFWYTSGDPVAPYLKPAKVDLFLSADAKDVIEAHSNGCAAGHIYGLPKTVADRHVGQLRIAFDGDAVIFAEESEKIYKEKGIQTFLDHESENAARPIPDGPFANVFRALGKLRAALPPDEAWRIKIGLFTARNAPADQRVLQTMEQWDVHPDHLAFLGGVEKNETIQAFGPSIYFDDQSTHLVPLARFIPTACVPSSMNDLVNDIPLCPSCQEPMVERLALRGETAGKPFWGCSRYPRCTGNMSIA